MVAKVTVLAGVLAALLVVSASANATSKAWVVETSPPPDQAGSVHLNSVTMVPGSAGQEAWAFGSNEVTAGSFAPVVQHRTGGVWTNVPDTVPGTYTRLTGGVALGTSSVWAVGSYISNKQIRPLAEHWNGSAWKLARVPKAGKESAFNAVAISGTTGWAVGQQEVEGNGSPLIEAVEGSTWTIDGSLTTSPYNTNLLGVCQVPGTDEAWTVGTSNNTATFAAHYDGTNWVQVATPTVGTTDRLYAVACIGADDVWAVGQTFQTGIGYQPLIEHWDGSDWTVVSAPTFAQGAGLYGITAVPSSSRLWAVGVAKRHGADVPLIERWTGTAWRNVASPALTCDSQLNAVAGAIGQTLQAVGEQCQDDALTERYQ